MLRGADHEACGGDAVRHHDAQLVGRRPSRGLAVRVEVGVHVGETRDEELPGPSTRRTSAGTRTPRLGPTSAMRPSRTITVASRITVSEVIGTTATLVMAYVPVASAPREAGACAAAEIATR